MLMKMNQVGELDGQVGRKSVYVLQDKYGILVIRNNDNSTQFT